MTVLAAIGPAKFKYVGLAPERFSAESESRVPGKPTFRGMDYQKTGIGEQTVVIEARTVPHVFGGLDSVAWLRHLHETQATANYIRLGANYQGEFAGEVVIRNLAIDEGRLHPKTKIGREVSVEIEILYVGGRGQ